MHVTIEALDLGWVIVTSLIPESLSESKSASFDTQAIRGRSVPVYGYSHSETRTVDLSIILATIDGGGVATTTPPLKKGKDVWQCVNWLKSAVYPIYAGVIFPPTRISLRVGQFLYLPTAVITSVSVTWGDTWDAEGFPLKAEVSLSLEEVQDVPSSADEVVSRGY